MGFLIIFTHPLYFGYGFTVCVTSVSNLNELCKQQTFTAVDDLASIIKVDRLREKRRNFLRITKHLLNHFKM